MDNTTPATTGETEDQQFSTDEGDMSFGRMIGDQTPYYVMLEGYVVMSVTDEAIGIAKLEGSFGVPYTWLPKSLLRDQGDDLVVKDTGIEVEEWKAKQEDLDY